MNFNLKSRKSKKKLNSLPDPSQTLFPNELQLNPAYLTKTLRNSNFSDSPRFIGHQSKEILWGQALTKIDEIVKEGDAEEEEAGSGEDGDDYDDNDNVWKERLEIPNFWKAFSGVGPLRRSIWIFIFVISFGLFLYETFDRIGMLINTPHSSTVKLTYEGELTFPSITICPSYKFRDSLLKKFNVDRYGCKPGERHCSWDIPYNLATHTETIIKMCYYKQHYSCMPGTEDNGKWKRTITSLGRCFTYQASEPIYSGGDSDAFEIMIDPLLWDKWGNGSGIRVFIHGSGEVPLPEINGININPGSNGIYALQVKEFTRVYDTKHAVCSPSKIYSQSKCITRCMYDLVREKANTTCGAPFMIAYDIKTCDMKEDIINFVSSFDSVLNNDSAWHRCNSKCPARCQQTTYTPITSSLGFTHMNSSLVNISIYFSDMWVEKIVEQWDYNLEEFVADSGGSLNLFLGASFVTVIQFSDYFLSLIVFWAKNVLVNMKNLQNKVTTIHHPTIANGEKCVPFKINSIEVAW